MIPAFCMATAYPTPTRLCRGPGMHSVLHGMGHAVSLCMAMLLRFCLHQKQTESRNSCQLLPDKALPSQGRLGL